MRIHPPIAWLAALLLAAAANAQRPARFAQAPALPYDEIWARWQNFETAVVAPLLLSSDGSTLYVLNSAGARLALFDTTTFLRTREIAVGLGCSSITRRPGTEELWITDRVGNSVFVVDPALGAIVRTIRVGAEPYGIAFDAGGTRAWVTCAAAERIDVIRALDYTFVKSIPVPVESPRGIVATASGVWFVPFLSGNNTAPRGTTLAPNDVRTVDEIAGSGLLPLPDRDLLVVRPGQLPEQDRLDSGASITGLGTMLLNLHVRPGTEELWIPNTDALNAGHTGENSFVDGQVVRNRITIVDPAGGTRTIVDLDQLAPPGVRCAQPTGLAFDPIRPLVYVCGYGSDLVAVLRRAPNGSVAWEGVIHIPPKQSYPRGVGPRTAIVDPQGQWLYVFAMQDKAVVRINLTALPVAAPFAVTSAPGVNVGFELISGAERLGRHLFNDARLSKSMTSSCASCHVDGHTDGLAWDLSHFLDPQGTSRHLLQFGVDVKGPLVTQSVRSMIDTGPYHWRGERRRMEEFNPAFATLLKHEVNGVPSDIGADFQYLEHYVNRLAWLPNPRQNPDRSLTPAEARGAELFQHKQVLNGMTCAACHQLPLGTSGEVVAATPAGMLRSADVPALRGVGDKLAPAWDVGGAFGQRTTLGAGLTHGGAFASLRDVALQPRSDGSGLQQFAVTAQEAEDLEAFLLAFDTGFAPSTGFAATAHTANAASVESGPLLYLMEEARRGNCDLIAVKPPVVVAGRFVLQSALFDPVSGHFRLASANLPFQTPHQLIVEAQAGRPITFIGVPRGMGLPLALDRDLDGLQDLDELNLGLSPEFGNQDLDPFPDGYEVRWGLDPFVAEPLSASPDTEAPLLARPVRLVYATTNTLKFEVETDESCQLLVAYNGNYPVQRLPLAAHKDNRFSVVLGELEPDTDHVLDLTFKDPSGNIRVDHSARFRTRPRLVADSARIEAVGLAIGTNSLGPVVQIVVDLRQGALPALPGYVVLGSVYYQRSDGSLQTLHQNVPHTVDVSGLAVYRLTLSGATGTGGGTVIFVVHDVTAPPGVPGWVHAYDRVSTGTIAF